MGLPQKTLWALATGPQPLAQGQPKPVMMRSMLNMTIQQEEKSLIWGRKLRCNPSRTGGCSNWVQPQKVIDAWVYRSIMTSTPLGKVILLSCHLHLSCFCTERTQIISMTGTRRSLKPCIPEGTAMIIKEAGQRLSHTQTGAYGNTSHIFSGYY